MAAGAGMASRAAAGAGVPLMVVMVFPVTGAALANAVAPRVGDLDPCAFNPYAVVHIDPVARGLSHNDGGLSHDDRCGCDDHRGRLRHDDRRRLGHDDRLSDDDGRGGYNHRGRLSHDDDGRWGTMDRVSVDADGQRVAAAIAQTETDTDMIGHRRACDQRTGRRGDAAK
jgi:hypothetical protein